MEPSLTDIEFLETASYAPPENRSSTPGLETIAVPFELFMKKPALFLMPETTSPFYKLQVKLLLHLSDFIDDPVDKVSLALTCKVIWNVLKSRIHKRLFERQGILPSRINLSGLDRPWPYFQSCRWRLLERLEDRRWKCCAGCLSLQPNHDFPSRELELSRDPKNRYCKAPGLVQICPHVLLTYRKCQKLRSCLDRGNTLPASKLRHVCVLKSQKTTVTCDIIPKLSEEHKHLCFLNDYKISSFSIENMQEWMSAHGDEAFLPCPHHNISTHVRDELNKIQDWPQRMFPNITRAFGNDRKPLQCKMCATCYFDFKSSPISPQLGTRVVSFSTERHLDAT